MADTDKITGVENVAKKLAEQLMAVDETKKILLKGSGTTSVKKRTDDLVTLIKADLDATVKAAKLESADLVMTEAQVNDLAKKANDKIKAEMKNYKDFNGPQKDMLPIFKDGVKPIAEKIAKEQAKAKHVEGGIAKIYQEIERYGKEKKIDAAVIKQMKEDLEQLVKDSEYSKPDELAADKKALHKQIDAYVVLRKEREDAAKLPEGTDPEKKAKADALAKVGDSTIAVTTGTLQSLKIKNDKDKFENLPEENIKKAHKKGAERIHKAEFFGPEADVKLEDIEKKFGEAQKKAEKDQNKKRTAGHFLMAAAGATLIGGALFAGRKKDVDIDNIEEEAVKEPSTFQKIGKFLLKAVAVVLGGIAIQAAVQKQGFVETAKKDADLIKGKWTAMWAKNKDKPAEVGGPSGP